MAASRTSPRAPALRRKRTLVPALALVTLLLAPSALGVAGSEAPRVDAETCSVPCGYIYPLITMRLAEEFGNGPVPLAEEGALEIPATLTFQFDAANEGFALPHPSDPIVVSFEFPRKPDWVDMSVAPSRIEIPIQPQYLQPKADDPNNVQAHYVYTTDITIHVQATARAVLPDGLDVAKLLVFAKSTESGLYKPGYGIKEMRVEPENPLRESDVAQNDLDVRDVTPASLAPIVRSAGNVEVTVTPPAPEVPAWTPGAWTVNVETPNGDALDARVVATLLDEHGAVAYTTGPREAPGGETTFNLTLPGPGALTLAVDVRPREGGTSMGAFTPRAFAFPITLGPDAGDAVRYPEAYAAAYEETVRHPRGNPDAQDSTAQFEKIVPFPAFEGASGAVASVTLKSGVDSAVPGAAVAVIQILDPTGKVLAQASLDPVTLTRSVQAGALPGDGWFAVRVFGSGVPDAARFDVEVDVRYDDAPVAPRATDGVPDVLDAPVRFGFTNFTATLPDPVWPFGPQSIAFQAAREGATYEDRVTFAVSVQDEAGEAVYTGGVRTASDGAASVQFTPPAPGRFMALATLEPAPAGGLAWEPLVLAVPVVAGEPDEPETTLKGFAIADEATFAAGAFPDWTTVAVHTVDVRAGASAFNAELRAAPGPVMGQLALKDVDGNVIATGAAYNAALEPGRYALEVQARGTGSLAAVLEGDLAYATPHVIANPLFAAEGDDTDSGPSIWPIPGPGALVGALALAGAAALIDVRRRGAA